MALESPWSRLERAHRNMASEAPWSRLERAHRNMASEAPWSRLERAHRNMASESPWSRLERAHRRCSLIGSPGLFAEPDRPLLVRTWAFQAEVLQRLPQTARGLHRNTL